MKLTSLSSSILLLCAWAQAADIFMPVPQGKFQGAMDVNYMRAGSWYDEDGKAQEGENGAFVSTTQITARGAFGIIANLEANVSVPYGMVSWGDDDDSDGESGMTKPTIGAKYGIADIGLAPFLEIAMPFGDEKMVGEDPTIEITGGLILDKMMGEVQARGGVGYTVRPEDKNKVNPGDVLSIALLPGYALSNNLIAELGIQYLTVGEAERDGVTRKEGDFNTLVVAPGVLFKPSETMKIEVLLPYTVMAKSYPGFWGIDFAAYMQF